MPSPWALVNKAALILTHPAVTASYLMCSRQPVRLTGQGLSQGPPSFVGWRVASGRARFLLGQNNLELLGHQAVEAGERLCIQGRVLLEIIISRPGGLLDGTGLSTRSAKKECGNKASEPRFALLSFPIHFFSGKGQHVGVSLQTGKVAIGEPLPHPLCV